MSPLYRLCYSIGKNEHRMKRKILYIVPLVAFAFLTLATTFIPLPNVYADTPAAATEADPGANLSPDIKCPSLSFDLAWAFCPVMKAMAFSVASMDNFINKEMTVGSSNDSSNPNQIFCDSQSSGQALKSCTAYHNAWTSVRNIALGLMGISIIIVLIAQALGFEFLDAYTIRKVLPRLLISAVGITLSWQLMQFFVTLSNDLAYGIRVIIYQPFVDFGDVTLGNGIFGSGTVASLLAIGALTALGWIGLLSYLLTALLAVFIALLVLILRQMLIIVLIIMAPIAIACYVLPNTQKVYKLWWESFSKALLMFVMIAALIAVGRVFSVVALTSTTGTIGQLVGFAAYFLPYFLIPATFKFAGSAMSQIGGFVNDRGKGGFDRLRGYRGNVAKKNMSDLATGNRLHNESTRFLGYGRFARGFNRATRNTANLQNAGYNPRRMRERMRAASGTAIVNQANEAAEKNEAFKTLLGNDDVMEAALYESIHGGGEATIRSILRERGFKEDMVSNAVGAFHNAKNSMGTEAFKTALAVHSFGTSSGWTPRYKKNAATGNYIDANGNDIAGGEQGDVSLRVLARGGGGAGEARAAIDSVAGNDRLRMISMLGQARQQAESKGRFDLVGGSFTQDVLNMERFHTGQLGGVTLGPNGEPSGIQTLTKLTHEGAIDGQARHRIASGHRRSMDALAPEFRKAIEASLYNSKGQDGWSADEGVAQLAFIANSLDAASNGAPENARVIKQQVLDQTIDVKNMPSEMVQAIANTPQKAEWLASQDSVTIGSLMEQMRTDPSFSRYRREYNRPEDSRLAGTAAELEAQQQQGKP